MNKQHHAFTLLELLIAMSLSTFIFFGLMQSYNNLMKFLENSRFTMGSDRKICLLLNQLERDFNTAFIPKIYQEVVPEKKEELEAEENTEEKKEEDKKPEKKEERKKKKDEKKRTLFMGACNDNVIDRINNKRHILFDNVTFICTSPLQVYGQQRTRFLRLRYQLVKDKQKSTSDHPVYTIVRTECYDIENATMKEDVFDQGKIEKAPIRSHVVADNIKAFYLEYITLKKKESAADPDEEIRSWNWGEKKDQKGVLPRFIEVTLVLWNNDAVTTTTIRATFAILSYPYIKATKKKNKKKATSGQSGETAEPQDAEDTGSLSGFGGLGL